MGNKTRAQYAEELLENELLHDIIDGRVKALYEQWVLHESEFNEGLIEDWRLAKVYMDLKATILTICKNELAPKDNVIVGGE